MRRMEATAGLALGLLGAVIALSIGVGVIGVYRPIASAAPARAPGVRLTRGGTGREARANGMKIGEQSAPASGPGGAQLVGAPQSGPATRTAVNLSAARDLGPSAGPMSAATMGGSPFIGMPMSNGVASGPIVGPVAPAPTVPPVTAPPRPPATVPAPVPVSSPGSPPTTVVVKPTPPPTTVTTVKASDDRSPSGSGSPDDGRQAQPPKAGSGSPDDGGHRAATVPTTSPEGS